MIYTLQNKSNNDLLLQGELFFNCPETLNYCTSTVIDTAVEDDVLTVYVNCYCGEKHLVYEKNLSV